MANDNAPLDASQIASQISSQNAARNAARTELSASPDVTDLLHAWSSGDRSAGEALFSAVYDELRRQASRAMRFEPADGTLQATAVVHEAYLRLVDQRRAKWHNRAQFFGVSAELMRRILVDHARARLAEKRGGGVSNVTLGDDVSSSESESVEIVALHEALERLAVMDPPQARIVELRYFGGLTIEEAAEATGVSPTTVKAEWAIARAWLRRELALT